MLTTAGLREDARPLYEPFELVIQNWHGLHAAIDQLSEAYLHEQFVWRGQADASWGLFSSLYRQVAEQLQRAPTEEDLVAAERRLLTLAREHWRLDGIPALPLFARMQHVGVPTRLIDATLNPLIAAWFAVASDVDADKDARLFAFTVKGKIQLNTKWSGNTPRWHSNAYFQNPSDWGTGLGRRVWLPPALHARIPAQSAAFLLDGVPVDGPVNAMPRHNRDETSTWTAAQTREVASIPLRLARIRPESRPLSKGLVFTYRITAKSKPGIRHQLEERFGYRFATIYADIEGLATYLARNPAVLTRQRRETEPQTIIDDEHLKPDETRRFIAHAFADGAIQTTGTAVTNILPPVSRFAPANGHGERKARVLSRLAAFLDRFLGLGNSG